MLERSLKMEDAHQVYFRSSRFKIIEGEEEETNPGCFGKELATWLCEEFTNRGYEDAIAFAEDFGWCVMCSRQGCMQWFGCGSVYSTKAEPEMEDIVWTVFPVAEIPFYDLLGLVRRLTGRIRLDDIRARLGAELVDLLDSKDFIDYCEPP